MEMRTPGSSLGTLTISASSVAETSTATLAREVKFAGACWKGVGSAANRVQSPCWCQQLEGEIVDARRVQACRGAADAWAACINLVWKD